MKESAWQQWMKIMMQLRLLRLKLRNLNRLLLIPGLRRLFRGSLGLPNKWELHKINLVCLLNRLHLWETNSTNLSKISVALIHSRVKLLFKWVLPWKMKCKKCKWGANPLAEENLECNLLRMTEGLWVHPAFIINYLSITARENSLNKKCLKSQSLSYLLMLILKWFQH